MTRSEKKYNLGAIYTLDLANNHEGDVAHGMKIISDLDAVAFYRMALEAANRNFHRVMSGKPALWVIG